LSGVKEMIFCRRKSSRNPGLR